MSFVPTSIPVVCVLYHVLAVTEMLVAVLNVCGDEEDIDDQGTAFNVFLLIHRSTQPSIHSA